MSQPETVTMSKADHEVLLRAKALVDKNWKDPKIGPAFRASAKAEFPDITIPEDTVSPVVEPLKAELEELKTANKALLERLDKKDKEDTEKAQTQSLEQALKSARDKYSLTDEGFDKMVARMKDTGNYSDAEAAAAWVASTMPAPKPQTGPSWVPPDLNLYGSKTADENFALLHQNPESYFDKVTAEILNEAAA